MWLVMNPLEGWGYKFVHFAKWLRTHHNAVNRLHFKVDFRSAINGRDSSEYHRQCKCPRGSRNRRSAIGGKHQPFDVFGFFHIGIVTQEAA